MAEDSLPVLQIIQILLAAIIALIPILYPRISLYRRQASVGLSKLENPVYAMGDITMAVLERGEPGFSAINRAITNHYPLSGEVNRIRVALGTSDKLESKLDLDLGPMLGKNSVVYVEYSNTTERKYDIVTFHPFDPLQTLKLTELRQWIRNTAVSRSHYATMITAIIWTVISILLVI